MNATTLSTATINATNYVNRITNFGVIPAKVKFADRQRDYEHLLILLNITKESMNYFLAEFNNYDNSSAIRLEAYCRYLDKYDECEDYIKRLTDLLDYCESL